MRYLLLATLVTTLSLPALAQTTQPRPAAPPATMPSQVTPDTTVASPAGGLPGANSFTEGQARSRLEKEGFSNLSALAKDKDGIWRGRASKGAQEQAVGVDYKGNIIAN